ncbi:armadillo-type protein [Chytriomyces sp. MP71]|nr:armadillo-type protein [Chytriomyces sp. MP71]
MRKKELLETLVGLLSIEEPPEVLDEAAFALSNLAKDFALKAEIRKAGGIKALVKLLPSPDPDVKKNVALALSSLLEDFTNRAEIRYVNGLAPLLELLGAEFLEIQENTLMSLILSAEDQANRVEIRRLNGVKRLIDMLSQDLPELHQWTLLCLSKCLEDSETVNIFHEIGGIPPIMKLLSCEDIRAKRNSSLVLSKVARTERNQNYLREAGAIPALLANLNHTDLGTVSHAAIALGALAKNELNQLELNKIGVVEILIKLIAHDDADVCRQSVYALSSLCLNPPNRIDVVKMGGVATLLNVINKPDLPVQAAACLALGRCMQEAEARVSLTKEKKADSIARLISLVLSKDVSVARNAAYALSSAAQYDLSAKYWLRNELSSDNIIKDGFYDIGSAGPNLDGISGLPSLPNLKKQPVDKRREVLAIDFDHDPRLMQLCQAASSNLSTYTPRQQLRQVATVVSNAMGGAVDVAALSEFAFKFKITELKMKMETNILPLGHVSTGTFYHRALLFKAVCDRIGLGPCSLVRGEYNRAWVVVDIRKQTIVVGTSRVATPASKKLPPSREAPVGGLASSGTPKQVLAAQNAAAVASGVLPADWMPQPEPDEFPEEVTIVDLMFEPGRLLGISSPEAAAYKSPA